MCHFKVAIPIIRPFNMSNGLQLTINALTLMLAHTRHQLGCLESAVAEANAASNANKKAAETNIDVIVVAGRVLHIR